MFEQLLSFSSFFLGWIRGDLARSQVARWLYSVGAADDIYTQDSNGNTPMHSAGVNTLPWLVRAA